MSDLSLVHIRYSAPISAIDLIDSTRRIVSIQGSDFSNVEKVIFAGREIKEYVVVGNSEIQLTLPPPPLDLNDTTRVVISPSSSLNDLDKNSIIEVGLDHSRSSSGQSLALQRFFKILLTRKGSNFFDPRQGTLLTRLIGSSDPDTSLVDAAVQDAVSQVISSQEQETLLASEILTSVQVRSSYFDPNHASIYIELEISTADGISRFTEINL